MIENYPPSGTTRSPSSMRLCCDEDTTDRHRVLIRAALGFILLAVSPSHAPILTCGAMSGSAFLKTIPRLDQYAFTSDREWINHEWLAESAMAIAFAVAVGPASLCSRCCCALACWRSCGMTESPAGHTAARDLLIAPHSCGTFPQLNHVRPQISVVAFALLIWIPAQRTGTTPAAHSSSLRGMGQLPWRLDRRRRCSHCGRC